MTYRRYVAIGDSTTEGLDDPCPDGSGRYRGWADRLAHDLARVQGGIEYANLAVRGRTTRQIREEQLPVALDLRPDLSTCVAGMNDLIRPAFDAQAVVGDIEAMHRALAEAGATVVTFTLPAPGPGMPIARLIRPRVLRFNAALRASAKRTGVVVFDLGAHAVASDPRLWSDDRLHANSDGHARIAAGLAALLGLEGSDDRWSQPLPPLPKRPLAAALGADLVWARTHLVPWARRHLRGESSGDDVTAKRPIPLPVEAYD